MARDEIEGMAGEVEALRAGLASAQAALAESRANDRTAMHWLSSVREAAGHDGDFPSLVEAVRGMLAELDALNGQEPVAWVNTANLASAEVERGRGGQGDTHTWAERPTAYHTKALYARPIPPAPSVPDERAAFAEFFCSAMRLPLDADLTQYDEAWLPWKAWKARAALAAAPKPEGE